MPRAEVGTPKYLANKMKAKGLQKLRWYCQMCQKQCRDENGFKCHTMSESHQRQILLFAESPKKYMDEFSFDLAKDFLQILRRQFGTKRISANKVYQEYIRDRNHVHMNSTRWVTLGGFVKWLGHTGKCIIDETEKGWYITYIDRDPETIAREKRMNKKKKMDKDDDERNMEFIENQIKMDREKLGEQTPEEPTTSELIRENQEETLRLELKLLKPKPEIFPVPLHKIKREKVDETAISTSTDHVFLKPESKPKKIKLERQKTALDEIKEMEERKKEERNRKDYWVAEGIVVKILTSSLGPDFYKKKGVIREVIGKYGTVVKLLESGKKIKVDQEHLETVIPAIGKNVLIVNGAYRGELATLLGIDEKEFCASLEIAKGPLKGRKLEKVAYEDFSKLNE